MKALWKLILSFFLISLFFTNTGFSTEKKNKAESDYKIGKGDVLSINVWKEEDLTIKATRVRLDGKITLPLIDDIKASGFTSMELKEKIKKKLSEFVESPSVTVTLLEPGSQKFYILGEIRKTGEYQIKKSLTILQAFALAGGFTEWASKKEILLFRFKNGKKTKTRINYKDIVMGDLTKDIEVKADDIIVVP